MVQCERGTFCCLLLAAFLVTASADCELCDRGLPDLKRPYFRVDPYGTTCVLKAYNLYVEFDSKSEKCAWEQIKYREMCCGQKKPSEIEQVPTQPPGAAIPRTGDYPVCDVCWNKVFPGNPSMVINMLNLGVGSCKQYFEVGRAGMIVPQLCDTLQSFAYGPCGCEEAEKSIQSTGGGATSSAAGGTGTIQPRSPPSPTLAPTTMPKAGPPTKESSDTPSESPTGAPRKGPTKTPTTAPTAKQTLNPTNFPISLSSSHGPFRVPSRAPSPFPTKAPTRKPTIMPTAVPTTKPTEVPTPMPTAMRTSEPTVQATKPTPEPTTSGTSLPVNRWNPYYDGKDGLTKLSSYGQRGGSGGLGGRRFLKGARK